MQFRHYKGGVYDFVCEATLEADHTPLIIYRAANGTVWARPKHVFFEMVEVDGRQLPRFAPLADD